ncbi:MAG: hydroxyacid dehydrogenase [Candidatus Bathyarchaeia archaeon]
MKKKLLVVMRKDLISQIFDDETLNCIRSITDVALKNNARGLSEEDYSRVIREVGAEILITCWGSPKVTVNVLKDNPQLRYMCHTAGTVRSFVEKEAIESGLSVTNWGSAIARSVAEAALMMILCSLRRVTKLTFSMHVRKEWPRHVIPEGLFYQRVGLHGFGAIARELCKFLAPFKCEVSAYSPHVPDEIFMGCNVKRVNSLEELFEKNRIISVHAANTPENHHIINQDILRRMVGGGIIVNTARGAIIDEKALVEELKRGRIYAALDVFEEEPLPADSPLRGIENCMLIPHMGGPTHDRRVDMGKMALKNIEHYVKEEPLESLITPRRYDLIT